MTNDLTERLKEAGRLEAETDLSHDIVAEDGRVVLTSKDLTEAASLIQRLEGEREKPIDMVLFCPACGVQHIDEPEPSLGPRFRDPGRNDEWTNPPHRSHLCHGCGHIWRPADVPTNGVLKVATVGKSDSPLATPEQALSASQKEVERLTGALKLARDRLDKAGQIIPPAIDAALQTGGKEHG